MQIKQAKKIFPVLIITAALALAVFIVFLKPSKESAPITEQSWQVATTIAKKGSYSPQIILYGITESARESNMRAAVEADVKKVNVDEGDKVARDQVLLLLDDRDLLLLLQGRQADVDILKAKIIAEKNRFENDKLALKHEQKLVTLSKTELRRQLRLRKQNVVADITVDIAERALKNNQLSADKRQLEIKDHANRLRQLEAELSSAQAQLDQVKLDLSRTIIKSPFAALVSRVNVSLGDRVREGDSLIELYDVAKIEVRAQIPSGSVHKAHRALADNTIINATANLDGKPLSLRLSNLAAKVTTGSGGVDAIFKITSHDAHLALGRSMKITVTLPERKDVFALPVSALYQSNRIYVMKESRMVSVPVTVVGTLYSEKNQRNKVLVVGDRLKENDIVIITQLPQARDGLRVKTTQSDEDNKKSIRSSASGRSN